MDKEVVHIYNGILFSHIKDEITSFSATWVDLEIVILNEEVREWMANIRWYLLYVESKLKATNKGDISYMWNLK